MFFHLGSHEGSSCCGTWWIGVISALVFTVVGWWFMKFLPHKDIRKKIFNLQTRRELKLAELERKLKGSQSNLVTPARRDIRKLTFTDLRAKLQSGELKAVEVLDAYAACALAVTREVNCVTEFIEEAQEWAVALDELGPGKGGPLHGIPVSIKENFGILGYDSTYGIGKRVGMPSTKDQTLVAVLKSLGALPFCRTNIPQTMLSFGCGNPVYGRSENPYQKGRTTGGSSSGEGCLIGAGGSILGLGSDVGGSVRMPAAFCGCVSLKPTIGRLSRLGMHEPFHGLVGMSSTAGFMARGTDALEFVYREVTRSELQRKIDLLQPDLNPIEIEAEGRRLVVGFCDEDGYFPPTPGMKRAVSLAKEILAKRGHRVVPFRIPDAGRAFRLYLDLIKADGMVQIRERMEGEPVDSSVMLNTILARVPLIVSKILAPVASLVSPKTAAVLDSGVTSSADLWTTVHETNEYRRSFVEKMREAELDVLLCPAFALPAPPHELCSFLLTACCYTALFNLIDLPAGVVPVAFEGEEDQKKLEDYSAAGDKMHADAKKATKGATGLPLSVQFAGLPFAESAVLHAMKELEVGLQDTGEEPSWLHSTEPWNSLSSK